MSLKMSHGALRYFISIFPAFFIIQNMQPRPPTHTHCTAKCRVQAFQMILKRLLSFESDLNQSNVVSQDLISNPLRPDKKLLALALK